MKTLYAKIAILDRNELQIESIEGLCTGGSISLNAKSLMRRSGSLTVIANSENYNLTDVDNVFSINKRISISIGVEKENSENIYWFPMGVFILSNASISKN